MSTSKSKHGASLLFSSLASEPGLEVRAAPPTTAASGAPSP